MCERRQISLRITTSSTWFRRSSRTARRTPTGPGSAGDAWAAIPASSSCTRAAPTSSRRSISSMKSAFTSYLTFRTYFFYLLCAMYCVVNMIKPALYLRFTAKTKNKWSERHNFKKVPGKYDLIQLDYSPKQVPLKTGIALHIPTITWNMQMCPYSCST